MGKAQVPIFRIVDNLEDIQIDAAVQLESGSLVFVQGQELLEFDGYDITSFYSIPDSVGAVRTVLTEKNAVLVGSDQGFLLNILMDSLQWSKRISKAAVTSITVLSQQEYLISTSGDGLFTSDFKNFAENCTLSHTELDFVNDLKRIGDNLYYATDQGLLQSDMDFGALTTVYGSQRTVIRELYAEDDSALWSIDYNGIVHRYLILEGELSEIPFEEKKAGDHLVLFNGRAITSDEEGVHIHYKGRTATSKIKGVRYIMADEEAGLWVYTEEGAMRASLAFGRLEVVSDMDIHCLAMIKDHLYIGTDTNVTRIDLKSRNKLQLLEGKNFTSAISVDEHVVFGSYDSGVFILDDKGNTQSISIANGLANNTVLSLLKLDNSRFALCTIEGLQIVNKVAGHWQVEPVIEGSESYYGLCLAVDQSGDIWMGTDKQGLIQFTESRAKNYDQIDGDRELGSVRSIHFDEQNVAWIVSEELGLLRSEGNEFHEVQSPHGQWGNITSLCEISNSRFLLIGERSIDIYDHDDGELISYTREIGLSRNLSFLNNYCHGEESLIFEHHNTLYEYYLDGVSSRTEPITSLEAVMVNLRPVDTTEATFTENQNNFEFTYKGVLFRDPSKVKYTYRLLGHHEDWRITRDQRVSYTGLSPNKYKFQLRSSHDEFQDNITPISYAFEVKQLWYNRWYIRALAIITLLLLILAWNKRNHAQRELKSRMALLNTEAKLRTLKEQLDPHFLFNSFNTVIGLIEEGSDNSVIFIERLTDYYRMVLEIGDSELIPIEKEVDMLKAYLHVLQARFDGGLKTIISDEIGPGLIPPMSLQILVENAIKHNSFNFESPMLIKVTQVQGEITVSNDVRPRSSVAGSMGIGLNNLKQRFSLLAGKEIKIEEDKTHFSVSLPIIVQSNGPLNKNSISPSDRS